MDVEMNIQTICMNMLRGQPVVCKSQIVAQSRKKLRKNKFYLKDTRLLTSPM